MAEQKTMHRFTLMVEDSFDTDIQNEVMVIGQLHGTVFQGDRIEVLYPGRVVLHAEVKRIESGSSDHAVQAENEAVSLLLDGIDGATLVRRYTVVCTEEENTNLSGRTVRNPYLLGLSYEYDTWNEDMEYRNCLMYAVCHTNYVVPIIYNERKEDAGSAVRMKRNDLRFTSLKDPVNKQPVFPVFTDWPSFGRWTAFLQKHEPATKVMMFSEIINLMKSGYHGMVINAFGPKAIFLSEETINALLSSPAYQQEFARRGMGGLTQHNQTSDQQVMLGYPAENSEVKAIREGLAAYAKADEQVRQLNFLLKQEADGTLAYLCIVDCDAENEQKIFSSIYRQVGMYLKNITNMDFMRLENAGFASQALQMKEPLYRK